MSAHFSGVKQMPSMKHYKGRYGLVDDDVPGSGSHCHWCDRIMVVGTSTHPTRDHYMPRSVGGRKIVMACTTCNNIKGDMLPHEWRQFMADNPQWWLMPRTQLKQARRSKATEEARHVRKIAAGFDAMVKGRPS
jgi:hypothetical protein